MGFRSNLAIRSSNCLSECPPEWTNTDSEANGRTRKPYITIASHPATCGFRSCQAAVLRLLARMPSRMDKHRFGHQRTDPKSYTTIANLLATMGFRNNLVTRSSGCLSACPCIRINTDLGTSGRTKKHARRQQITPLQSNSLITPATVGFTCHLLAWTISKSPNNPAA